MAENSLIKTEAYDTISQSYDLLLQEGIEWIQKFSGQQWTDYNYHDPGITLLEQLCFAITDLGYKSNFPLEDLLFLGRSKFDHKNKNLLYPPHEILPSSPITVNDYRMLIVDQIDEIQNAWVYPQTENPLNFSGLFSVKLQLTDSTSEVERRKTVDKVRGLLMKNRSVGTDFAEISPLQKEELHFSCTLLLDSFSMGEQVLAELLIQLEDLLSNHLDFRDYEDLKKENYTVDQLFTGTFTKKGFLNDSNLKEKRSEIYISELKELMYNIPGVVGLKDLIFYKNGIQVFEDFISFDSDSYPVLQQPDELLFSDENNIRCQRNESNYSLDSVIFHQIYDALKVQNKNTYTKTFVPSAELKKGRFSLKEFEQYYSIVNELPAIYGTKQNELPSKSGDLRKAQVQQLRAYIFLFDQIMANHVSQLTHLKEILSIDIENDKTLHHQIPKDFPDLENLLSQKTKSQYSKYLSQILENREEYHRRKNKILDHLLARFGESFDTTTLQKTKKSVANQLSEKEIQTYGLVAKMNYLNHIKHLGYTRNLAFDYTQDRQEDQNISGIENRLKYKLAIPKAISESVLVQLSEQGNLNRSKGKWEENSIELKDGSTIQILALPESNYTDGKIHFYLNQSFHVSRLFSQGIRRRNFKIVEAQKNAIILFNQGDNIPYPIKIYQGDSFKKCSEVADQVVERFLHLNEISEGFSMVENILLRPMASKKHELLIYDENQNTMLKSLAEFNMDELNVLRDDFKILARDKKNYNVVSDPQTNTFDIVVYDLSNKPIFKSVKSFKTEADAKLQLPLMIQFLKRIIENEKIAEHSEICVINDLSNQFPEDFNYSNHVNFVFPDWPIRFQNKEIKNHIRSTLKEFMPVHIRYSIFFINLEEMGFFESCYFQWLEAKIKGDPEVIDKFSLQLIQMLLDFKKKYGK